ncbi:MAG: hypothetical protein KC457_11250 [Myxococcales bacterium]|nr:hypothetical protein [Myxococcales bacterium]
MRLLAPPIALALTLIAPALAEASPLAVDIDPARLHELTQSQRHQTWTIAPEDAPVGDVAADPAEEAPADPTEDAPTDDGATEGPAEDDMAGDPTAEDGEDEDDEDLEDELSGPVKKGDFNANAIGINGGIHLVPSYFLNTALASYANSLCRDKVGNWGADNGLVKVDGCNFYINGGYTRRVSRVFDVSVNVGYLHIKPPDALWIDNSEWDRGSCSVDGGTNSSCDLGAADYTEIDLRMVTIEVDFVARGKLYRNENVEIQLGGGGGVGVGILIGEGVRRTPLGSDPGPNCTTLADTADFTKCTPRYYDDPDIDQDGDGMIDAQGRKVDISRDMVDMNGGVGPNGDTISTGTSFAGCSKNKCKGSDLAAFGATETGGTWPAYPLVNIIGSFRIIVKDAFGITIDGGIKDGFFFGGGMQYYFGGGGKDKN